MSDPLGVPSAEDGKAQIDDILDSTRTAVFFIDDLQVVRPGEVGSTDLIREAAARRSIEVREFNLEAEGATARLVAGFCWPWSNPDATGELVPDVRVGEWAMPWNAHAGAGKLAPGIPKSDFWAQDPKGINQAGCVYTAQGFEFDYVGVIFGPDLVYRPMDGGWIGQPKESFDRVVSRGVTTAEFTACVKNTYRVFLTRALVGCWVYFADQGTRDFDLGRTGYSRAPHMKVAGS